MDFTVTDDLAAYRADATAWVRANLDPAWADAQYETGTHHTIELHRRMARDGLLGAGFPSEYGGSDVAPDLMRAIYRELIDVGIRMDAWMTTFMIANTILRVGTDEQKEEYVRAATRGDLLIALGYTEPDSGSDVAAAKTSAVLDGDHWVLNGQKMFTSTAEVCSHVIVLARTDPEAPKHRGLSMFLVPTSAPGFEIQPIHTLGHQRTNSTFYGDVRVPASALIGGPGEGWHVLRTALVFERGVGMPYRPLVVWRDLARLAPRTVQPDGFEAFDEPTVASRIGRMATESEVARLLAARLQWMVGRGEMPGVEGSMAKLYRSEADQRHHRHALDALAADGLLSPGSPGALADGRLEHGFCASVVLTIYGGSSEIMREMIAEGRLGLPRGRSR